MNYQEMSNTQINVEVAKGLGFDSKLFLEAVECGEKPLYGERFDPCNSWADAGPIAEENEIGVVKVLNGWCATNVHAKHEGVFFVDPNPRRAICIVFLMMKGGE